MSTEDAIIEVLEFAAKELPVASIIETVAGWFDEHGATPEQLHAALTDAAVRRQKALKDIADAEAFPGA